MRARARRKLLPEFNDYSRLLARTAYLVFSSLSYDTSNIRICMPSYGEICF